MKQLVLILTALALLIMGCGKKTIPTRETTANTKTGADKPVTVKPATPPRDPGTDKTVKDSSTIETEKKESAILSPLIVIDGMGKILTPKHQLPAHIAAKADYGSLARAFTPNQRTNLVYRYKMIPPRVLFVPESFIQTSAKGKYIVYRKKFWYWQKQDGLFYLDETYYK